MPVLRPYVGFGGEEQSSFYITRWHMRADGRCRQAAAARTKSKRTGWVAMHLSCSFAYEVGRCAVSSDADSADSSQVYVMSAWKLVRRRLRRPRVSWPPGYPWLASACEVRKAGRCIVSKDTEIKKYREEKYKLSVPYVLFQGVFLWCWI